LLQGLLVNYQDYELSTNEALKDQSEFPVFNLIHKVYQESRARNDTMIQYR